MFEIRPPITASLNRRRFVQGAVAAGSVFGLGKALTSERAWAAAHPMSSLTGSQFDLAIGRMPVNFTGRAAVATSVNGSVPGPILHWRQGDTVTLNVTNHLDVPTSIHWHGIRSPAAMDGVPGLSFRGIAPGETFAYRIPLLQSGTYWYHSHSGFQEQTGLYGAIVVAPKDGYAVPFDRDYVVMLSDWSDTSPETIVSNLKGQSDYYNYGQRTLPSLFADASKHGLSATIADRLEWGKMRMSPTDIADVTGATYTYLLNGQPPASGWTGLFRPGERVRLRLINGSAMTFFDVRIPGLKMTVVEADGNSVQPVLVDELRLGVAETYDVIVQPTEDRAYTVFVQSEDRSGYARGTLASREGMVGAVPSMDPRPIRSMTDMGMGNMDMSGNKAAMTTGAESSTRAAPDHSGGMAGITPGQPMMPKDHGSMAGTDMGPGSMPGMMSSDANPGPQTPNKIHAAGTRTHGKAPAHGAKPAVVASAGSMPGMDMTGGSVPGMDMSKGGAMAGMDMSGGSMPGMDMGNMDMQLDPTAKRMQGKPSVDNVAMMPTERLHEAGDGLDGNGRRVLTYADLRATQPGDDRRAPSREILLHISGNMTRYMWGFDGKKFSEAEPIRLKLNERVRFVLINDTMMEHPIHLHGLWSELENGQGEFRPYKHTIIVKPGEKLSYLVTADEPGRWAYHCHLLYHMEMGMFRTVIVA